MSAPRRLLSIQTVAERQDETVPNVWKKIKKQIYPQPIYPDGVTPKIIEEELDAVNEGARKARDNGEVRGRLRARGTKAMSAAGHAGKKRRAAESIEANKPELVRP